VAGIIKDGGSMSKLDDLIKSSDTLRSLANTFGMKQEIEVPPELPSADLGETKYGLLDQNPLYAVPRSTIPTDLPQNIRAYRADPTGKFGGKEGIETLPINRFLKGGDQYHPQNLDPKTSTTYTDPSKAVQEIYRYARLAGAAEKDGLPTVSSQELASFILQEGRSDAGMSGGSYGGNYVNKLKKDLTSKYNIPNEDINFLTTVADKKRIADKLGISFAEAWNGTGKSIAGKTGKDYAREMEGTSKIAEHPKNADLMAIIKKGIEDGKKHGLPLNENAYKDSIYSKKKVPYNAGGGVEMPDEYSKGSWKLI